MTRRLLAALFGALTGVLLLSVPAAAHSDLSASNPANGAELDAVPGSITLTFGEPLQGATAKIGVLVGDHDPVQIEAAISGSMLTIDTAVDQLAEIVADADGQWTIGYQAVSADGHPVDGTVTFTVTSSAGGSAPDAATANASGGAVAPAAAESSDAEVSADDAGAASGDDASEDAQMPPLLWLATLAVIGLVVFAVVKIDRMRRKKAQDAADKDAGRS